MRTVRCECGNEHAGRDGGPCGPCRDREAAREHGPGDDAFDLAQEARVFEGTIEDIRYERGER